MYYFEGIPEILEDGEKTVAKGLSVQLVRISWCGLGSPYHCLRLIKYAQAHLKYGSYPIFVENLLSGYVCRSLPPPLCMEERGGEPFGGSDGRYL